MHNRARIITASFLVRTLGIDWRHGYRHFAALLADGDVANNAGNWQWVAGTGNNPCPSRDSCATPIRWPAWRAETSASRLGGYAGSLPASRPGQASRRDGAAPRERSPAGRGSRLSGLCDDAELV
jgi:hypothetical protein